ncbi:MAG TPA: ATP-binding protein, partial [Candidatus Acidoferrales bacterium]|nr:ATP-binding protein [Candidatus Acidoferrales bacterium]
MTIRLRLTLYWAAVLGAILLVAAIAAAGLFERQQWAALDAALLEEAETTAEEIQRGSPAHAPEVVERLSKEADLGPGRRVRLMTAREIVTDSGDAHTAPPSVSPPFPAKSVMIRDRDFRFAVAPLTFDGQPACLLSGIAVTPIAGTIARMRNSLLLTVPIVLILCVAGGYWLAGRALSPIDAIRSDLDAIGPLNLSSRLPNPPVADEVARLIRVINALLERLERASATERRFASDAAHELRTPLAILRTGMEVALARDRSAEETRAALALAHREVLSLCKIADELLMLARLGGEVAVNRARLNLRELVADIAATVEPLAEARGARLIVDADTDVFLDANDAHLRRQLINLLDNALKFTPEGGSIEVAVTSESNRATIRVADSGPGIPPDEMPLIF